jgi:hypothetical protein
MAEFRTAADFGIVKRPPYSWRSQFGVPGLFSPSKEEAEAIRKKEEKDRLIAQAQLRQQKAAGLVGNALAQEQQGPLDRTAQLNLAPPNALDRVALERGRAINEGNQYDIEVDGQTRSYGFDEPLADSGMQALREREGITADIDPETEAIQAARMGDTSLSQQALGMVSPDAPVSNSDRLNQFSDQYLAKVGKRKKLLSGIAGLFGVTSRADEYERNALIKYTDYVDNQALLIAMEGGLPPTRAQFLSKHIKAGGSAESGLEAMEGIWPEAAEAASAPTPNKIVEMRFNEEAGKEIPYDVYREWSANGWQEVSAAPKMAATTEISITTPGELTQTVMAKNFGEKLGNILGDTTTWGAFHKESAQLPILIDAIASGQVDTGKLAEMTLPLKQAFAWFLPDSEMKKLFTGNLGRIEWFKAVVDSFVGTKLQMTKGSISEREMKIFQKMIPGLTLTPEGNIRLLNMMHALNRIEMSVETGAINFSKWADTQEGGVGGRSGNKNFLKLKEFQKNEENRAIRFLNYLANAPVGVGVQPIPLNRAKAFNQLRAANAADVTDAQLNAQLDKWGYPSG